MANKTQACKVVEPSGEKVSTKAHKVPTDPVALAAYRKENFSKWYKTKGKLTHSENRKKKYHEDAEYREAVKARNQVVKQRIRVPMEGRIVRVIEGSKSLVYRIGQVAEKIGKSAHVIRSWEKMGLIPTPSIPEARRIYTEHQVDLLKGLVAAMDAAKGDSDKMAEVKDTQHEIIHQRWDAKED